MGRDQRGDELWKRNVRLCCIHEVRWRGCGARLIGLQGRRYKLWWPGNQEGYGGVDVLVREELYKKVNEVRRVNDRVIFFLYFRLIPKKLMSSYTGMEEFEKTNTTTKRKM